MKQSGYDMLYLSSCAVNGIKPDSEMLKQIDMEKLFQMCEFHSLTALVCTALEAAEAVPSAKWTEAKAKALRKIILLDAERERILRFMEENRIWYLPLKGIILKELYPKPGMRQMADNDILFDGAYRERLKEFMLEQGYTLASSKKSNHDEYLKPPVYNFELHASLTSKVSGEVWAEYYSDVKERLIKSESCSYGYRFTDEDCYIYMTAHEYKHYSTGGTGLRSLIDSYVYLRAKESCLDRNYIDGELKKLGIYDFEKKTRELSFRLFSSADMPELTYDERELLEFFLLSGTYGTERNTVKNRMKAINGSKKESRLKYYFRRIFPGMDFYKTYYPFFYKHKLLLPAAWLFRLLRGLTVKGKQVRREVRLMKDIDS